MKTRLIAAAAILLVLCAGVFAHRLDEYLQATILSVGKDRVQASMRLVPGVAVSSVVLASIDTDGDGVFSEPEQQSYVQRVLGDLSVTVDGKSVQPALVSYRFPAVEEIKEGLGEIRIEFVLELGDGGGERKIVLENHHQNGMSTYLVNCLVPSDPLIKIVGQKRNESQSFYEVDYAQSVAAAGLQGASGVRGRMGEVGFASIFRLGMRHIAEGTDHLLFLLTLLLPAPLLLVGRRWAGFAGARQSVLRILKVVTAFTAGHSLTLALAALGVVRVPSGPIEVFIAISILVSAAHALRPLFPGKEAGIAVFFGLIHGLAFASVLGELGLRGWALVTSLLAFNLGIETMQLIVVAVTMPCLVLFSRARWYWVVRMGGAVFAGVAAVGWIGERAAWLYNRVGYGVWVALGLLVVSTACWGACGFGWNFVGTAEEQKG
jgi:hypothetical protein